MPITIKQGRPRSPYFPVFQPIPGNTLHSGDEIECINPKTGVVTKGIVTHHAWVFDWNDPHLFKGFLLLNYGFDPETLRAALVATDPAFDTKRAVLIAIKETI